MEPVVVSLFFHNYYGQHENWMRFFSEKITVPFILYYNIVEDSLYNLEEEGLYGLESYDRLAGRLYRASMGQFLKKIVLRRSPNKGKDIGGKLVLLDAFLREGTESPYALFLHDKRSPQKAEGVEWKEKLFRIIEPGFVEKALALFGQNKELGIIAASDALRSESPDGANTFGNPNGKDGSNGDDSPNGNDSPNGSNIFVSRNGAHLERLRSELDIRNTDLRYVAGTMFWSRLDPLRDFFERFPPLEIRKTLEGGNVMDETTGSVTHAWERMLTWLIFAQGYTIKGL